MALDIISYSKIQQLLKKAGFVGTKKVNETGLKDDNIIQYSAELDEYVSKELKTKIKQWQPNHKYEKNEIVVFDDRLYWSLNDHKSHSSDIDFNVIDGDMLPFVTEAGLANVLGLEANIVDGVLVIEWTNPTSPTYEGREVFISDKLDVTTMRYQECVDAVVIGEVEKITTGLGTGEGVEDSVTHEVVKRKKYYVKVFVNHYEDEVDKVSSGRYLFVENPDVTPPIATSDLKGVYEDGKFKLTWTNPTDEDFLYSKLVRSVSGNPTSPTEGMVLDAISGEGTYVDTIEKETIYYYKVFFFDDAGNGFETGKEGNWSASNGVEIEIKPSYGFDIATGERLEDAIGKTQEDFDSIYPWSHISRAVVDGSGVVQYYLDVEDSSLQEDGITPSKLDGTDGNVVVEYPEFYYSYEGGKVFFGEEMFDGATLMPRMLVGAFEATETETGELQSVANVNPLVDKSISEYRLMSGNIGAGWQQKDIAFLDILKHLFLVEYGGFNSQTLVGQGVVGAETFNQTGGTITLGNKSGSSVDGSVSYRGLENPWGNTWEFVEGLVATDANYYKATEGFESFANDMSKGDYVSTGQVPITEDGYISALDVNGVLVANEVLGSNTDHVGDYQYSHKAGEINIGVHGGNFADGDKAGLFRLHMGLKPFGKEEDMDFAYDITDEDEVKTHTVFEKELTESELEKIKGISVN